MLMCDAFAASLWEWGNIAPRERLAAMHHVLVMLACRQSARLRERTSRLPPCSAPTVRSAIRSAVRSKVRSNHLSFPRTEPSGALARPRADSDAELPFIGCLHRVSCPCRQLVIILLDFAVAQAGDRTTIRARGSRLVALYDRMTSCHSQH